MDYFYKCFDSALANVNIMSCDTTIFPVLEKYADDIKDYRQHMDVVCLIKKADPQQLSHLWNKLENGTILGDSTNIYSNTLSKACDLI